MSGSHKNISIADHDIIHEILVFDEPTNSLDEKTEKKIISLILNLDNKNVLFIR